MNGGLLQADGGQVLLSAGARDSLLASVVNNTGVIQARTVQEKDGKIILLAGMAGSRIPVVVSHGEGRAAFSAETDLAAAAVSLRYIDNTGDLASSYPANPNGSPMGITGLTSADGRATLMMPHPERVAFSKQMSWHPKQWDELSPWMQLFVNARKWVN